MMFDLWFWMYWWGWMIQFSHSLWMMNGRRVSCCGTMMVHWLLGNLRWMVLLNLNSWLLSMDIWHIDRSWSGVKIEK